MKVVYLRLRMLSLSRQMVFLLLTPPVMATVRRYFWNMTCNFVTWLRRFTPNFVAY